MKVALVHDWLTGLRGGERCLQAFLQIYPDADIFTLIHVPGSTDEIIDKRVKATSFFQKLPGVQKYYRLLLPLFPLAIRRFDLRGYDLIISLSHAAAKNVRIPKNSFHICYCFTPMRYIWDQAYSYFGKLTPFIWPLISILRKWDLQGAKSVNCFVAISRFVAGRIRCFYGRPSEIIYPPVDTAMFAAAPSYKKGEAFLYAGALVPYKKVDLIVKAFSHIDAPLWIVGSGPEEKKLKRLAGTNVSFFGSVPDTELASFYQRCRALVFPGTEDFGMIPVECMASGRPVIGINDGAVKESLNGLKPWNNCGIDKGLASGVFIQKSTSDEVQAIIDSIEYFLQVEGDITPQSCRAQAEKFSKATFYDSWEKLIIRLGLTKKAESN